MDVVVGAIEVGLVSSVIDIDEGPLIRRNASSKESPFSVLEEGGVPLTGGEVWVGSIGLRGYDVVFEVGGSGIAASTGGPDCLICLPEPEG